MYNLSKVHQPGDSITKSEIRYPSVRIDGYRKGKMYANDFHQSAWLHTHTYISSFTSHRSANSNSSISIFTSAVKLSRQTFVLLHFLPLFSFVYTNSLHSFRVLLQMKGHIIEEIFILLSHIYSLRVPFPVQNYSIFPFHYHTLIRRIHSILASFVPYLLT